MNNKRLYKNSDDAVIAGVCSGLADYLNMDVTLVRVLVVAIVFFTGVGIIPYILFAVLLPEKRDVMGQDEPVYEKQEEKKEDDLYEYNEDDYKY